MIKDYELLDCQKIAVKHFRFIWLPHLKAGN